MIATKDVAAVAADHLSKRDFHGSTVRSCSAIVTSSMIEAASIITENRNPTSRISCSPMKRRKRAYERRAVFRYEQTPILRWRAFNEGRISRHCEASTDKRHSYYL
jgi:hypothetical protein